MDRRDLQFEAERHEHEHVCAVTRFVFRLSASVSRNA